MNNFIESAQIALLLVVIVQFIHGILLTRNTTTGKDTFHAVANPFTFIVFAVALAILLEK